MRLGIYHSHSPFVVSLPSNFIISRYGISTASSTRVGRCASSTAITPGSSRRASIEQEGAASDTWIIKGTDNLNDAGICYKNAFYVLLKEWFCGRDYTCTLLTKQKYEEILKLCLDLIDGANCRTLYIAGNKQAYKWATKYDAIVVGGRVQCLFCA